MSEPNQSSPSESAATERQLCLKCLVPNDVSAHFCSECGAPLSSYAATAPFEHILAEGHTYRQAAESPRSIIVVLGVWLIFGSMALLGIFQLLISRELGAVSIIISAFLLLVSSAIIWKTTTNYLAWIRTREASRSTLDNTASND